jgi:hypothetical protein
MNPGSQLSERADDVIELISSRREELARKMTERIPLEIPEYEQIDTDQHRNLLFESCRKHVDGFVHYLRTGNFSSIAGGDELAETTMDRVRRGLRLDAYLHAFRIGQNVFWEEILDKAGDRPDTALEFAGPSMDYIDHVCNQIASLYLQASHQLRSDEERAGRDLLEALLDGSELDNSQSRMVSALGLEQGTLIAVLRGTDGDQAKMGTDAFRHGLTQRLSLVRATCLVVARQGLLVLVIGTSPDQTTPAVAAVTSSLPEGILCGVSTISENLKDLGNLFDEALAALRGTRGDRPIIALTETTAYEYLILTSSPTVMRVINPALLELLSEPGERAVLAETARAYLESDLSVKRAAEKLFVHTNTLRYRLDQIQMRAGIDFRRITDLTELRIALDLTERDGRQDR